jgi:hypothetical protein
MLFIKGNNTLQISVTGDNGELVTGLSIGYVVKKSSDNSTFSSGSLTEIAGVYYTTINFTTLGQYRVIYSLPSGYESGIDEILVIDDPAKESTVAKENQATTNTNSIISEVNANETKIDLIKTQTDKIPSIKTETDKIATLIHTETGKWKILNNQLIFYKTTGEELMRFNLYDEDGNLTETNVVERRPV